MMNAGWGRAVMVRLHLEEAGTGISYEFISQDVGFYRNHMN